MYRGLHSTDAGMHCIWDPSAFDSVVDYDTWAHELLNDRDIERHVVAGHFVPLNIGDDGAMEVEVRSGTADQIAALTDREAKYLIVKSEPYLFRTNGQACVSGIEHVAVPPTLPVGTIEMLPGEYAAVVHLIAWDEEPGMQTDEGPAEGALPDYIVLINPTLGVGKFRTELHTFEQA